MPRTPERYTLLDDLDDYESDVPLYDDDDNHSINDSNMTAFPRKGAKRRSFKKYLLEAIVLALGIYFVLHYAHKIQVPVLSATPTYVNQTLILIAIFFAFRYFT